MAEQFPLGTVPIGVLTAATRHQQKAQNTLQSKAWMAICSLRSSVWAAVLVPVAGEAARD